MLDKFTTQRREVLLITGLGDDQTVNNQVKYVNWLNKRRPDDAQIRVFPTLWQTPETYKDKRERLTDFINLNASVKVVYAISAGASLGMSLMPELDSDIEYQFISGKLQSSETVGPKFRKRAPALYDSVVASEKVIESVDLTKRNITCRAGYLDGVLEQKDMRIDNVTFKRIPIINHSAAIVLAYLTTLRKL